MFENKTKLFAIMIGITICAVIIIPTLPDSHAHATREKSDPSPNQSLSVAPTKVDVYFSDPVDIRFSQLKVLDSNGKQIQLEDQKYIGTDQQALSVSLPPNLKNGIYTVDTKVLDQTDGHVTVDAFYFGIGQEVPKNLQPSAKIQLSAPEAVARFPSLVGQVMVAGVAASALWIWAPISRISRLEDAISKTRLDIQVSTGRILVIGSVIVLAAGFAMIIVQAYSINAGIQDAISTKFGNMWILRMVASSVLFGLTFALYTRVKKSQTLVSRTYIIAILATSFVVLLSTSLISHGAATGKLISVVLDFMHNVFASLWIGGIIYIAFAISPHLKRSSNSKSNISTLLLIIPRFSIIVIMVLGAVTITGPFLLYMLEGNLGLVLVSFYGKILMIKLGLAAAMIALGGYNQMFIFKKAYSIVSDNTNTALTEVKSILGSFDRGIRIEAFIGIALIAAVAVLVDSGLPSSEFGDQAQYSQNNVFALTGDIQNQDLTQTRFMSDGSRVVLNINPFYTGSNQFTVSFLDSNKNELDMKSAQIKMTQTDSGIGPITIDAEKISDGRFTAKTDFGFAGHWSIRVEGVQNKDNTLNLVASYNLFVKPRLDNLQIDIKEYKTPDNTSTPRYPIYDNSRNKVWIGDTSRGSGKILDFDLVTNKITEHKIDGVYGIIYSALDSKNTLWYIDYQNKTLGNYNPDNNSNKFYKIPNNGILTGIAADGNDVLWILSNTNDLIKFDIKTGRFDSIKLPDKADPLGIAIDSTQGTIWIAEGVGRVSSVNMSDNKVSEYTPQENFTMKDPTGIILDPQTGKLYISEHSGRALTIFDPLLGTFKKIQLDQDNDNLPYGMAFDKYHNLWVAQHTIDKISAIDTRTGQIIEKSLPSSNTWTQWIVPDSQGNIVIAEEKSHAVGVITISSGQPQTAQESTQSPIPSIIYTQIAGPSIAGLLVIVGLFYSKAVIDLRKARDQVQKISSF